jgi:hypothetical protein
MAAEILLVDGNKELQRIRIPYNGRGVFDVLNETLELEDLDVLSWADYSGKAMRKLDPFEVRDLHTRLMGALSDVMLVDVWRYPSGSPLTTLEKMDIQGRLVELLGLLREAQRNSSHREVLVIA